MEPEGEVGGAESTTTTTTTKPKKALTDEEKRERQREYQQMYRKVQKQRKEQLEKNQLKGCEVLTIHTDGEVNTKPLRTEEDYIELIEGFLDSLKARKYLIGFRISREPQSE